MRGVAGEEGDWDESGREGGSDSAANERGDQEEGAVEESCQPVPGPGNRNNKYRNSMKILRIHKL